MNFQPVFTLPEILSLLGLAQCIYILVYMGFRAGHVRQVILPFLYFLVLSLAFFLDFAQRFVAGAGNVFMIAEWLAWYAGPPLSVLLILQIARMTEPPSWRRGWPLLLLPVFGVIAVAFAHRDRTCVANHCPALNDWLVIAGLAVGLASIASLWRERAVLRALPAQQAGTDRYWLVLMVLFLNLAFLAVMLLGLTPALDGRQAGMIRTLIGLGLVYLAGTSLFRIYPQPFQAAVKAVRPIPLSASDQDLIKRVENLLSLDKVYQESAYNRADLARELNIPESVLSRVINTHFGKSLPQLLNDRRVDDASRLLVGTDLPIKTIAEQVGFTSAASFNRVFREVTGITPTMFRAEKAELQTGIGGK